MAIDTVRIKDLEEVSVNDLANMWMVVDSGTPDSTNKVKLSALAGYIGGQADGRYIPLAGSSEITGSLLPKADKAIALGSGSFRWSALYSGEVHASDVLAIPTAAPSDPLPGEVYLYSGTGEYSETPGGGGVGDVYKLTLRKGSTSLGVYDPAGPQDQTIDIAAAFSSYLTSVPAASSSDYGGFKYGDPIDTMLVMNDGYLAVDLVSLAATTQSIVDAAVTGLTPKVQAIPYIVGPDSDATAGTWTGTYEGITALTEGLTIVYVAHVAGASTTTLNINGLGAKTCYWTGTSKMTTQYPAGTPILLTYHNNGWRRADANTTYSAGTKALFDAGTNTSNRVWSASVLASAVAPKEHEHAWADITGAPAFITADALNGYATETYVGNQITALNLGTASQKDYVTSITSGGTDLPTAGAIYTYVNNAVTAAQPYKGVSSTAITDGGTEMPTISGYTTRTKGDVVAYNKKEFIWEGDKWRELGDEGSYALKTVQVIAGTGLTGGGAISQDITLSLSSATQTDIGKGVTAYGWGNHASAGYASDSVVVKQIKIGTASALSPTNGLVTLPAYPTSLPASDVYDWAKASTKPTYSLSEITGADDLKAIEALTGTSGLLKKTAANTWTLDTTSYVPATRKVNGHALSADVTVSKGDVGLGNVENTALSTWPGTSNITTLGTITTGTWHGTAIANSYLANSSVTINSKSLSLGGSLTLKLSDLTDDILSGHYLPLSGGTLTGALNGTSASFSGNINASGHIIADGTISAEGSIATASDFNADGDVYATNIMPNDDMGCLGGQGQGYEWSEIWGNSIHAYTLQTTIAEVSGNLAIPTATPTSPTSGKIYLYASSLGEYAVEPWYGFNQLISNGNMESTTGWGTVYSGYTRTVENNVLTLTITSATYRPQVRTALSVANGHWVYYTYTMKYTTSAAYSDVKTAFLYPTPLYIPTGNQKDADYYDWKKTSGIVKVNAAKTYLYIGRTAASSHTFAVGDTVQIKNVMVCDLTEMFGDENIPTVEQFEAMYPQDYYEYTPIGG